MQSHGMAGAGDRILAGISGGPDSMALIRVLMELRERLGITLGLAHLNHNLRGDASDRDEAFVRSFARENGLELAVESLDVRGLARRHKLSQEEAGRNARYAFFNRVADSRGYTRIALGHHWDDHVEQVLMSLVRGTGPKGLCGISPVRENRIIRPLIQTSKADILEYLNQKEQAFVTDASNQDPAFLRNRVRHKLIPLLEEAFNPEIRTGLDRLSQILSIEDDFMSDQADAAFDKVRAIPPQRPAPGAGVALSAPGLSELHPALAGRVLRKGILQVKQDLRRITHSHIRDILTLAAGKNSGKSLDFPGQIRVYKKGGLIYIKKEEIPLRKLGRMQKSNRLKSRGNPGTKT
ncbi:MAG: tRNA lysidine(34) synthetase TilS [Desulfobacter sp.]